MIAATPFPMRLDSSRDPFLPELGYGQCTEVLDLDYYRDQVCTNSEYVHGSGLCFFHSRKTQATKAKILKYVDKTALKKRRALEKMNDDAFAKWIYRFEHPDRPKWWHYWLRTHEDVLDAIGAIAKRATFGRINNELAAQCVKMLEIAERVVTRLERKRRVEKHEAAETVAATRGEKITHDVNADTALSRRFKKKHDERLS